MPPNNLNACGTRLFSRPSRASVKGARRARMSPIRAVPRTVSCGYRAAEASTPVRLAEHSAELGDSMVTICYHRLHEAKEPMKSAKSLLRNCGRCCEQNRGRDSATNFCESRRPPIWRPFAFGRISESCRCRTRHPRHHPKKASHQQFLWLSSRLAYFNLTVP